MKKRKEVTFDWKFQRMNPDDEKQLQIVINSVITEIVFKYLRERDKAASISAAQMSEIKDR